MFAGNSTINISDLDNVLKILELVGDDPTKTKSNVQHVRALQAEFERLAKEQTEFAHEREEHAAKTAAIDKELTAREADLARRENVVKAAEVRVANLENDLRRRLALIKSAAA
jgi:chromosome segregation ATPase